MKEEDQIPDKLYFRIGEVAKLIGVEPYVLRYWESEFPEISPVKSQTKQRLYKRQDVELICRIRDLLYHQKFTIKGAKKKIHEIRREKMPSEPVRQISLDVGLSAGASAENIKVIKSIISEMDEFIQS